MGGYKKSFAGYNMADGADGGKGNLKMSKYKLMYTRRNLPWSHLKPNYVYFKDFFQVGFLI